MSRWLSALKIWNNKRTTNFFIPTKNTKEHAEIMAIASKLPVPPKKTLTPEEKRERKKKRERKTARDPKPKSAPEKGGINTEEDLLKFTMSGRYETEPIPFDGTEWIMKLFMIYLLKKHKNDCLIYSKKFSNVLVFVAMKLYKKKGATYKSLSVPAAGTKSGKTDLDKRAFLNKLVQCGKNGFKVIIPVAFFDARQRWGHANMVIYDYQKNIIEHYEPYGAPYINEEISNSLKMLFKFEDILPAHKFRSHDLCQDFTKGLQIMEEEAPMEKVQKRGFFIQDPPGFCLAWSFYYADLRLTFPNKSPEELLSSTAKVVNEDPKKLKQFIRGFSGVYITILDKFRKELLKKGVTQKNLQQFSEGKGVQIIYDVIDREYVKFGAHVDSRLK